MTASLYRGFLNRSIDGGTASQFVGKPAVLPRGGAGAGAGAGAGGAGAGAGGGRRESTRIEREGGGDTAPRAWSGGDPCFPRQSARPLGLVFSV